MRFFRTIFITVVIVVAIIALWQVGKRNVSLGVLPPLDEFIASSTRSRQATSTEQTSSVWMASSTIVSMLLSGSTTTVSDNFSGNATKASTSTTLVPVRKPSTPVKAARSTLEDGYVKAPKGTIRLLVAKTPSSREHGLSGYDSIAQDQAMLFIFPRSESVGFWMKDMKFPIDIVWIGANRKIAGISENISPNTYPKTFISPGDVQFVMEMNANAATKFGLKKGTALSF